MENELMVGLDVGSTTVKAIVVRRENDEMIWQDYQRHETKQPEKSLEFLRRIEEEVTAVSLAVEKMHPEVYSVVELGGQDAKIIVFKDDSDTGRKKKIPSMNDKCAGGTGAVIDKINAKLKIPTVDLGNQA